MWWSAEHSVCIRLDEASPLHGWVSAGCVLDKQALVPLLAPGSSWVIQGRCCGMLTLLIRHELRTHVRAHENCGWFLLLAAWWLLHCCRVALLVYMLYRFRHV